MKNIAWGIFAGTAAIALAMLVGRMLTDPGLPSGQVEGAAHLQAMAMAADVSVGELRQVNEALREIAALLQERESERESQSADFLRVMVSIEERLAQDAAGAEKPGSSPEATKADPGETASPPDSAGTKPARESPGFVDPLASLGIEEQGTDALQTTDGPVYAIERDGRFGAAVAIGPKHLLTAKHLGLGRGRVRVGSTWYWADISGVPDGRDMSIVTFRGAPRLTGVQVARAVPGQPVRLFSFNEKRFFAGTVRTRGAIRGGGYINELKVVPSEPGVFPGDSGSGVFDMQGRLIGIVGGFSKRTNDNRDVLYAPIDGVQLPSAPQGLANANANAKPVLTVYNADFSCPPCERLKAAIKAGEFAEFEVRFGRAGPEITRFPAIRYTDSGGVSRLYFGYSAATLPFLRSNAR